MKILKKDLKTLVIAVILLTAILSSSVMVVNAAKENDTYLDITASPNPVGRGQYIYVVFWLTVYPPTAAGAGGDRWREMSLQIRTIATGRMRSLLLKISS